MRTPYKAQAESRAWQLGCTWDYQGQHHPVALDAPAGHVFSSTGTHAVAAPDRDDEGRLRLVAIYKGALHDMSMGIEPCVDPDCDVCEKRGAR